MKKTGVYFPGLNGLRFMAAFAVIITHIELMKSYLQLAHRWDDIWEQLHRPFETPFSGIKDGNIHWVSPMVAEAGPLGVIFFFVLSGFLITYLLFVEKEKTGSIGIRKFYMRRILRIWPLYYLVFILGFFVFPHIDLFLVPKQIPALTEHFWINFFCYVTIFPNLATAMFIDEALVVSNISQAWSIGVEEQFYLIWPVILGFAKKPLKALIVTTGIMVGIKTIVLFMQPSFGDLDWFLTLKNFLVMSKIECMTIGGLMAWLLFHKKAKWLSFLYSRKVQLGAFIIIPFLLYFTPVIIQDGIHLVYALAFAIIILNVSSNKYTLISLENPFLNGLGKISYGIYMYHLLVIVLVLNSMKLFMDDDVHKLTYVQEIMLYSLSIGLTLGISYLSYHYFERLFIQRKRRYTQVVSGDEART
jgi:peptidoglycan/LPS O-acetylase OafA/YrhL